MDDLCDTCGALDVGAGERLHDWRVHPYFACRSSHCAGAGPLSEAMTAEMICYIIAFIYEKGVMENETLCWTH